MVYDSSQPYAKPQRHMPQVRYDTGSKQRYGDFARDLRKAITRNTLPEYSLAEVEGANGPTLSMYRDEAKSEFRDKRFKPPS